MPPYNPPGPTVHCTTHSEATTKYCLCVMLQAYLCPICCLVMSRSISTPPNVNARVTHHDVVCSGRKLMQKERAESS
eukprot:1158711-Pelagomonas_calceolata.AAC.1